MATVHLIHGYLGAGKSRFARGLAARNNAVLISIDEWYLRLYTDGNPTSHQDYELLQRLVGALADHWPKVLRAGADVVLDFGFWRRSERDRARETANAVPASHRMYWVTADDEVAMLRCLSRNEMPGANFLIDQSAYRDLQARFEPPDDDEQFEVIKT